MSAPHPRHFYGKLGMTDEERRLAMEADMVRMYRELKEIECVPCSPKGRYLVTKIAKYRKMLENKEY